MEIDSTNGIGVVINTYDDHIELFERCINSLLVQDTIKEIIVVDSSKNSFIKDVCAKKGGKMRYYYTLPKGVSEAKNEGVLLSNYDIVAFTDTDCIVDKNWAENLYKSFSDNVAIVGGRILPKWLAKPNKIFLNSAIAQGFFSFFDMGDHLKEVEIIFGGGFAINKSLIKGQIFLPNLRTKRNLICGEETSLCKKVRNDKLKVIYNPSVIVWHQIPKERTSYRWMWRRMYDGGISRMIEGGRPTPRNVDAPYNMYDAIFLLIFIIPYIYGLFEGLRLSRLRSQSYSFQMRLD